MSFFSRSLHYSIKKSKQILFQAFQLFQRKKKKLSVDVRANIKGSLIALQNGILENDKEKSSAIAHQVETLSSVHLRKTTFDQIRDLIFALAFALIVAILIRQVWFEFYEIPTGSMRPTLKEQDRLAVSKTTFGINTPLQPSHLYFNPSLVQRNGIAVFTGENMDIPDVDTMYFYLFPGKKQYVKRMIGKPGDLLYFYGGQIFGMDKDGKDISSELNAKNLERIEHIPFIDFDRKLVTSQSPANGIFSPVYIYQMNEPVAKLFVTENNQVRGEMVVPQQIHASGAPAVKDYGDLWGFKNFAMGRLLTKDQVKFLTDQDPMTLEEGVLYLEIKHSPTLSSVKLVRDEMGRMRPTIGLSNSVIPLQEHHLKALLNNMYTARFEVKNGVAFRYGSSSKHVSNNIFLPHLSQVPDGCYEFYYGKAYKVKWQGLTEELPADHPIYKFTPARIQLLYNLGIEWDTRFSPQAKSQRLSPARYVYYRDGDLYLLGAPILNKQDPTLINFLEREKKRQEASNPQNPYRPFEDYGAPLTSDGSLDTTFIRQNGLLVPAKMYLMLGDNHAMSSDCRDFGFVPQSNLRGAPDIIFWPPGARWGFPNQPAYPWFNCPRTVIWILAAIAISGGMLYYRKKRELPLDFKDED